MERIARHAPGGWFAIGTVLLLAAATLDCMALQLVTGRLDAESSLRWVLATLIPLGIAALLLPRWRQIGGEGNWRHLAGGGLLLALLLIGLDLLVFGDPDGARWWELTRNKTAAAAALTFLAWRWPLARAGTEASKGTKLSARERQQIAAAAYVRAAGNYVELGGGPALVRASLAQIAALPEGADMVRIHRSFAVRTSVVQQLRNDRSGLVAVRLIGGEEIPVGRRYRTAAYRLRSCHSHPSS